MAVRFGTTLAANVVRSAFSLASGIIVARVLGVTNYGQVSFLLGSFTAIGALLEMGTSSAFYTFVSERKRGPAFFLLYFGWIAFQFIFTCFVVGLLLPDWAVDYIWVASKRSIILEAFAASFASLQLWTTVVQLGESSRETLTVQTVAAFQSFLHLLLVAAAAYLGRLSAITLFALIIAEYAILSAFIGPRLFRTRYSHQLHEPEEYGLVFKQFSRYCLPLLVYSWMGFLYAFADRWLIQHFGGAEQQGYLAVAQQFANVSLLAASSLSRVFWKEVAEAQERGDEQRVRRLYQSISRMVYVAGAWVSCLIIPYSRQVLIWTVGREYSSAALPLSLMLFYPIHQSFSQIQGAFLYAIRKTDIYTQIGLMNMVLSIPVTYLLLASPSAWFPGLGLGAVGVALKMVLLQVIAVTVQSYLIAKRNRWNHEFAYQGTILVALLATAWSAKFVSEKLLFLIGQSFNLPIVTVALGALLYTVSTIVFVWRFPSVLGIDRSVFDKAIDQVRSFLPGYFRRPLTNHP